MSEYCINCQHLDPKTNDCLRTKTIDLVTGKSKYRSAYLERHYEFIENCGANAKFFEPITTIYPNNWYEGHYEYEAPF